MEPVKRNVADGTDQAKGVDRVSGEGLEGPAEQFGHSESKISRDAEMDIVLGRRRREANDKYFQRVNDGVIDVVAKLEDVAVAMRAVEQESQDVWSEGGAVNKTL
jgi:hypothetical protein